MRRLCMKMERLAMALSAILKDETGVNSESASRERRLMAIEHQMMQISRELIRKLEFEDHDVVEDYVYQLSASRERCLAKRLPLAGLV